MKTSINVYCQASGVQSIGPGHSQTNVSLLAPAADNAGVFTKPTAAGGVSLSDVTTEFAANFQPGKRYTVTVEEVVETPSPA